MDGAAVGTAVGLAVGTSVGVAVGVAVGVYVGSSVGLSVGLAVGAEVAAHAVVLPKIVTKPSRQGQEYVWLFTSSAQYVDAKSQPCEPSLQACLVGE